MLTFLHAADIHLDSPLHNLDLYEGAPVEEFRQATRRAFENLIHLAISEKVAFVLIAGDLYDGDWKNFRQEISLGIKKGLSAPMARYHPPPQAWIKNRIL
jgi:Calcineurin-like phosphoesterase